MKIPRRFHRLWLGGEEPEWTQGFSQSWSEHHPHWRVHEWTDENISALFPLRNQRLYDEAAEITEHVGQFRSDIVRYELLHRVGGVWVDTDFECLRPLDRLIADSECFAAWEVQDRWIANGLMGSIPGHPFIDRLIRGLPASVQRLRGARPNKLSGPQYVTRHYRVNSSIDVLDESFFYPYGYDEVAEHQPGEEWPDAWAVHHWQNKRRRFGIPVG